MRIANIPVPVNMDIHECASYLGISADTMYKYAATKYVPAFRLGNRWRFNKVLIDDWIRRECEKNERKYPDVKNGGIK